jgi:branched-chain amino acid transport system substrate-binding protein
MALEDASVPLVVCDDRGDSQAAAACMAHFDSAGVRVVVGPMTSGVAVAVAREADRRGMVVVSPTVSHPALGGLDDRFLKLMPDNLRQADILARNEIAHRTRRVAVLFETRNAAFSQTLAGRFERLMREAGSEILFVEGYTSGPELDFGPWISRVPDSTTFLVVGSSMDLGVFQRNREAVGKRLRVLGTQWAMGADLLRVGAAGAEGMFLVGMPEQVGATSQLRHLRDRYRDRFAKPPSFGAVFAWEAAQFALRLRAGDASEASLREVLRDTLYAPLGWPLELDSLGDSRRWPHLCRVRGGRFEVVE